MSTEKSLPNEPKNKPELPSLGSLAARFGLFRNKLSQDDKALVGTQIAAEIVQYRDLPINLSLKGTIQPDNGKETDVSTRILGRIVSVNVRLGDSVKVDQLLAVLDSQEVSELEAEMIEAKSKLRVANAQKDRERQIFQEQLLRPKSLIAAKTQLREAKAQAELAASELARQEGLHKEKITSMKSFMEAKAKDETARAVLEEARSQAAREEELYKNQALLKKDFQIAEAEAARAAQHLDTLKQRLEFLGMHPKTVEEVLSTGKISGELQVVAPVAGVISHEEVAVGEVVHTALSMFKILDLSTVIVKADVPEEDLSLVKVGSPVVVMTTSYPDEQFEGTINYVADRVNPDTHALTVSAKLPNKDRKFKANMSAEIDLSGPTKSILACPRAALIHSSDNVFVFVQEGNSYSLRPIETGLESKEYVEVTKGLKDNDQVVVDGEKVLFALCEKRVK